MFDAFMDLDAAGMQPLDHQSLEKLKKDFPGLPEAYFSFLEQYGFGDSGSLIFYEGPIALEDVYFKITAPARLLPFCDDGQGYVYCFDVADSGHVVCVDPRGDVEDVERETFLEFLFAYFGDEDGFGEGDGF